MHGYWRNPEETARVLKDGWYNTGDIVEIRDGRVYIRGRLKDVIALSTEEKVDPNAIEAELLRCPLFAQVAVVGERRHRVRLQLRRRRPARARRVGANWFGQ